MDSSGHMDNFQTENSFGGCQADFMNQAGLDQQGGCDPMMDNLTNMMEQTNVVGDFGHNVGGMSLL